MCCFGVFAGIWGTILISVLVLSAEHENIASGRVRRPFPGKGEKPTSRGSR